MNNILSPQDIAAADKASGWKTPTVTANPQSRASQIAALYQKTTPTTPTTTSTPSSVNNPSSLGDFVGQAQEAGAKNIAQDVQQGADTYQAGVDQADKGGLGNTIMGGAKATGGLFESGMNTASDALMTLFSPITGGVNYVADKLSNIPALQHLATGPVGDAMQSVQDHISSVAQSNPRAAKDISSALNIILAGIGEGSATAGEGSMIDSANKSLTANTPDVIGGIKSGINDATDAVKSGVENVKNTVGNAVDTAGNKISSTVGNIKERISPALTPEEQIGKIIQGKTTDIPAAQRTFESLGKDINPAKMESGDLSNAIQTKISDNLSKVDTYFANDTTPHQMSEFEQTTGKGASEVKTNYVQQAIDQLKAHYTATNDAAGLSDIKALEEKANTTGLSSQELNNLAKEHGTELPKAFSKTGEPLSGLNKQATENTRAGVKTTARDMLAKSDPEAAKAVAKLDKNTSDSIHTKNLIDKQIEKEAVDVQKNGKAGALQKWIKENPIKAKIAGFVGADKIIKATTGLGF